jgi:catechol 2,3-dioxygenase
MTALATTPTLPSTLRLGAVRLTVTDLDRSVAWYQSALGLRVHEHGATTAALGDGATTVVELAEDAQARPAGRHGGLYHYALLYPSREELARAAVRLARARTPIQGASDHKTHEAIYLPDPDGNGIELAADRPRDSWPSPEVEYATGPAPLDLDGLLATIEGEEPADHVEPGLVMGHLHLHVGDIDEGLAFYRDVLGFEVRANLGSAAFVSAGGYHHHLGFNVWKGRGVGSAPDDVVGLRFWTVGLDTPEEVQAVRGRVVAAGLPVTDVERGFEVRDPWNTAVRIVAAAEHGRAVVATAKPSPYLLQVAKHFRHTLPVTFSSDEATIPFKFGAARLQVADGALVIDAYAATPEARGRVEHVIGGHLERFGRRDGLAVRWSAA